MQVIERLRARLLILDAALAASSARGGDIDLSAQFLRSLEESRSLLIELRTRVNRDLARFEGYETVAAE